jgi:deoxyribonuclease V
MHEWNLTLKEAIEVQHRLREQILIAPLESAPRRIAGADVSMDRASKEGFAGFVVLSYPELLPMATSVVKSAIPFPYIPGLLSFREIPMLLAAWEPLSPKPDLILVDGVGIAHPRRIGIASHLGLVLGVPTIGVSKTVLTGTYLPPDNTAGATSPLTDIKSGEVIGVALKSKRNCTPLFISPGHMITLPEALDIVRKCIRSHRLAEPVRLAHLAVNEYRRRETT